MLLGLAFGKYTGQKLNLIPKRCVTVMLLKGWLLSAASCSVIPDSPGAVLMHEELPLTSIGPVLVDNDFMNASELRLQYGLKRLIAVSGQVTSLEADVHDKPFFVLAEDAERNRSVFVGAISNGFRPMVSIGSRLRIMGFILRTDEVDSPLNIDAEHVVVGICFVDELIGRFAYYPHYADECEAWLSGRLADEPTISKRLGAARK